MRLVRLYDGGADRAGRFLSTNLRHYIQSRVDKTPPDERLNFLKSLKHSIFEKQSWGHYKMVSSVESGHQCFEVSYGHPRTGL